MRSSTSSSNPANRVLHGAIGDVSWALCATCARVPSPSSSQLHGAGRLCSDVLPACCKLHQVSVSVTQLDGRKLHQPDHQSCVCYQGLITLEEGTITEGLIWFRVESYHVVAADGKYFGYRPPQHDAEVVRQAET